MKSLRLCLVAATLATVVLSNGVLAQSAPELRAGALLEAAERLERDNRNDTAAITAAYAEALAAYDRLGDTDKSLELLDTLYAINNAACQDEEAHRWALQALEQFRLPQRQFDLSDRLTTYRRWVNAAADHYRRQGLSTPVLELYGAALENLATMANSMEQGTALDTQAEFLRSQLSLQPSDSYEASVTRQRLIATRQQAGIINEINGLLSDVRFLNNTPRGALPSSVELAQRVLELSRLHNYPPGEVQAATVLSQQALAQTDYDQAISYGTLVTTRFNQLDGVTPWLADAHYVIAQAQQTLGNDQAAIDHYGQLLRLIDNNNDPDVYIAVTQYTVLINLIGLYERIGDTSQANALAMEYGEVLNPTLPPASRVSFALPRPAFRVPRSFFPILRSCVRENPGGNRSVTPLIIPSPPSPLR